MTPVEASIALKYGFDPVVGSSPKTLIQFTSNV